MKDRWLGYVPAALLAALAGLTYWLDQQVQPMPPGRTGEGKSPDFLVEDLVATRMKTDGSPRYAVKAKKLVHYPADNSADLEYPDVTHFEPGQAPVTIKANRGQISNNGENVYLRGAVEIKRLAYADQPEMSLQTSFLHVIPDQDLVKTDRAVTLTRGNSTLESVGLEFNNATRTLNLLSEVTGTFETPAKGAAVALPWERRR
jgi:lipopolysaccharide export system protein LptC